MAAHHALCLHHSLAAALLHQLSLHSRASCTGNLGRASHLPNSLLQGAAVFLVGNALQLHSHALLAALSARTSSRRSRRSSSGAVRYRIPRGGAFEWVSCPHYLAEIVIYLGLALLAGANTHGPWLMVAWVVSVRPAQAWAGSVVLSTWPVCAAAAALPCAASSCGRFSPGLAVPVVQVVNLLLAAGLTQEWYRRQFKTYPKKRRAIIPFVY